MALPDVSAERMQMIEYGVATLALPGEKESGDHHLVKPFAEGILLAVVDGLGHGGEAAAAAHLAVATLEGYAPEQESLIGLVERCHEALRTTRGVVLSLAWLSAQDQNLTWLGVGNVEGMLLHAELSANPAYESIVPRRGVVGYQLPPLRAAVVPLIPHDTLIFVTDGIALDFAQGYAVSEAPQPAAERIMNQFRKGTDDALVLVARYRGGGEGDRERGQRPE